MNKRIIAILLILIFLISCTAPGYCYGPLRKLGRGIWNILTSPAEIPHRMNQRFKYAGGVTDIPSGFVEGCAMTLFRCCAGLIETGTFLIPIPDKYEPILKDPEFFFLNIPAEKK